MSAPSYDEVEALMGQLTTDEAASALYWLLGYVGPDEWGRDALSKATARQLDQRPVAS